VKFCVCRFISSLAQSIGRVFLFWGVLSEDDKNWHKYLSGLELQKIFVC